MSLRFLILSLLRELKDGFAQREKSYAQTANAEQGLQRLEHMHEQAALPMDDREELVNDFDLQSTIELTEALLATSPALVRAMRLLTSEIDRILTEEFSPEYWDEVGND